MTTSDRESLRATFMETSGWTHAAAQALPGDASFRRYTRLSAQDGPSVLLMDAPPPQEDVSAFCRVAAQLNRLGLSAPEILAQDTENGFLLIEDFGDTTFTNLLRNGDDDRPLYELAVDVLTHLHQHEAAADIDLPRYDLALLQKEADLLPFWYWPEHKGSDCPEAALAAYRTAWKEVFGALPEMPDTLVLRDYHVDNMMQLHGRIGVARCGLLDFQDAVIGPPAYDLISLLEDARRDIAPELRRDMLRRYVMAIPQINGGDLMPWLCALGAQRHAKVAGIFVRLYRRDGKAQYLPHIPRVLNLLARNLSQPALAPVRDWFDRFFPEAFDMPAHLDGDNKNTN